MWRVHMSELWSTEGELLFREVSIYRTIRREKFQKQNGHKNPRDSFFPSL